MTSRMAPNGSGALEGDGEDEDPKDALGVGVFVGGGVDAGELQ